MILKSYEQALIQAAIKRSLDRDFIDPAACDVVYLHEKPHVVLRSEGRVVQAFEIAPFGLGYELIARPAIDELAA